MKEHLFDKRVVKRALQEGLVDKAEYQRMLDALPDLSHRVQTAEDIAERESHAAAQTEAARARYEAAQAARGIHASSVQRDSNHLNDDVRASAYAADSGADLDDDDDDLDDEDDDDLDDDDDAEDADDAVDADKPSGAQAPQSGGDAQTAQAAAPAAPAAHAVEAADAPEAADADADADDDDDDEDDEDDDEDDDSDDPDATGGDAPSDP